MADASGMRRNLANYGDAGFSVFLRKAFIKALGYPDDALDPSPPATLRPRRLGPGATDETVLVKWSYWWSR